MSFVVASTLLLLLVASHVSGYMSALWERIPKDCGKSRLNPVHGIIDNLTGRKAELGQFPWVARLGDIKENGLIHFFCEGSLISAYYVITAIHCFDDIDVVRIGENHPSTDTDCDDSGVCAPPHQDIKPSRLIPEEVPFKSFDFNIMLVELESAVSFNAFVRPICLLREPIPFEFIAGNSVIVTGWGKTFTTNSSQLMYVTLPVVDVEDCKGWFPVNPDRAFCALIEEEEGKNVFAGDFGGGVVVSSKIDGVVRYYILGINSYDVPGIIFLTSFINVTNYLPFILHKMEKS